MIKKIESEMMICFIHRPSMYVGRLNRENIISFMHGVDLGRIKEYSWTNLLDEFVFSKYKISGGVMGWPYQVEAYSSEKNISWIQAFKDLMLQLIKESEIIPYTNKLHNLSQNMDKVNR